MPAFWRQREHLVSKFNKRHFRLFERDGLSLFNRTFYNMLNISMELFFIEIVLLKGRYIVMHGLIIKVSYAHLHCLYEHLCYNDCHMTLYT